MSQEQDNWNTRLAVRFIPKDGSAEIITPINNFSPKIDLPKDIIDSIDAHNLGFSSGNPRFSFDFEVAAVNKTIFRKIFAVAVAGTWFSVGVAIREGESDDWVFDSIEFNNCVITSVNPSSIDNGGGVPTMSFSAICLDFGATANGLSMATNHTTGANGSLY